MNTPEIGILPSASSPMSSAGSGPSFRRASTTVGAGPAMECCCMPVGISGVSVGHSTGGVAKSLPPVLLSVIIAFFPKCPMCWGVYMSMFGGLGLAPLPYAPWLLPVLMSFLGLHLLFLWARVKASGYAPFLFSLSGAMVIASGRFLFPQHQSIMFLGMALIFAGSLWNSLSTTVGTSRFRKTHPGA